jgi:hypothetical protein
LDFDSMGKKKLQALGIRNIIGLDREMIDGRN